MLRVQHTGPEAADSVAPPTAAPAQPSAPLVAPGADAPRPPAARSDGGRRGPPPPQPDGVAGPPDIDATTRTQDARGICASLRRAAVHAAAAVAGPGSHTALALAKLELGPDDTRLTYTYANKGAVLMLQPGLEYVAVRGFDAARAARDTRDAALAARALGTFAIAYSHRGVAIYEPASTAIMRPESLRALLARAVGPGAVDEWWASLATSSDVLLPHVRAALSLAEEEVASEAAGNAARGEAAQRSTHSIQVRARQLLHINALTRAIELGGQSPLPAHDLRRLASRQLLYLMGAMQPDAKPLSADFAGMVDAAGWKRVTKAESLYPWAREQAPVGHVPHVNVKYLYDAVVEHLGPLPDDDALWTVFRHLFLHDVEFSPDLEAAVDESFATTGGPLRLGHPSRVSPLHDQFLVVLRGWCERGVLRQLSPAEAADRKHCSAISPAKAVVKGPLLLSPAAAAALAAEPADLRALYAAANVTASGIVSEVKARLAKPGAPHPSVVLQEVIADHTEDAKIRMCHNGFYIGEFVHPFSFAYENWSHFLEDHAPGAQSARVDAKDFYYSFVYGPDSRKYLCIEYDGVVYQYQRLSMGLKCSAGVASLASALIVFIAKLRGCAGVHAYVDDFIIVHPTQTQQGVDTVVSILAGAEILEARGKRTDTATSNVIVGRLYDSVRETIELDHRKAHTYFVLTCVADELLASPDRNVRAAVDKSYLERVRGCLGWYADCTAAGKAHLGGLSAAVNHIGHALVVNTPSIVAAVRADLGWWRAKWAAGDALAPQRIVSNAAYAVLQVGGCAGGDTVAPIAGGQRVPQVASDAGDAAGGAVHAGEAIHVPWNAEERTKSADWRELKIVLRAFRRWGRHWRGRLVVVLTDNQGNFFNIGAGRAKGKVSGPEANLMVAELHEIASDCGFTFVVQWIPREANVVPDKVSKCATSADAAAVCTAHQLMLVPDAP